MHVFNVINTPKSKLRWNEIFQKIPKVQLWPVWTLAQSFNLTTSWFHKFSLLKMILLHTDGVHCNSDTSIIASLEFDFPTHDISLFSVVYPCVHLRLHDWDVWSDMLSHVFNSAT